MSTNGHWETSWRVSQRERLKEIERDYNNALNSLGAAIHALKEREEGMKPYPFLDAALNSTFTRSAFAFLSLFKSQLIEQGGLEHRMTPDDARLYAQTLLKRAYVWANKTDGLSRGLRDDSLDVIQRGRYADQTRVFLYLLKASRVEANIKCRYNDYKKELRYFETKFEFFERYKGQIGMAGIPEKIGSTVTKCYEFSPRAKDLMSGWSKDVLNLERALCKIRDFAEDIRRRKPQNAMSSRITSSTPSRLTEPKRAEKEFDKSRKIFRQKVAILRSADYIKKKNPFIRDCCNTTTAFSAVALTTIIQAELMEWVGFQKFHDELKKLIGADKWDSTFDKKLTEAKSDGHKMLNDAYLWHRKKHNDALIACCSSTSAVASSGVFEDVLGLFLAASDIVRKTTFLLEEYESTRVGIKDNVKPVLGQEKDNIEQDKQATKELNAILVKVEGARGILTRIILEWQHWEKKVDDIGKYEYENE